MLGKGGCFFIGDRLCSNWLLDKEWTFHKARVGRVQRVLLQELSLQEICRVFASVFFCKGFTELDKTFLQHLGQDRSFDKAVFWQKVVVLSLFRSVRVCVLCVCRACVLSMFFFSACQCV
jgi:hypothetical protein